MHYGLRGRKKCELALKRGKNRQLNTCVLLCCRTMPSYTKFPRPIFLPFFRLYVVPIIYLYGSAQTGGVEMDGDNMLC